MNTNLKLIPVSNPTGELQTNIDEWTTRLDVQSDVNYALNVRIGERTYKGSMKLLTENTVNNAGTNRFLLKVDVPLVHVAAPGNGCCCCETKSDTGIPAVSAHLVLTVPKSIAAGVTTSDVPSMDHISVATRILQAALASICVIPADSDYVSEGQIFFENAYLEKADMGGNNTQVKPLVYRNSDDEVQCVPVPEAAPIWGLLGGLRTLT